MKWISYSELYSNDVGITQLFIDYVENYEKVKDFYSANFKDKKEWRKKIEIVANRNINRTTLVKILMNQNRNFQCGVKTLANIDHLINDNTLAVITGQQLGIFGGPLYTIYKIITLLKLVDNLNYKYPECNFVPIFWLESEDHDFNEVSYVKVIDKSNSLFTIRYNLSLKPTEGNRMPVGEINIDEQMKEIFEQLGQNLVQTEFTNKIMDLFASSYKTNMKFRDAFVLLLNNLFENKGLIFFDPHDPECKKLMSPIFEKEISSVSHTCQLVISQSDILERNYHAQIKPRAINLFMFLNGARYAIEPQLNEFTLKGTRNTFSYNELMNKLHENPDVFSPNVILRPICQDFLFPTIAYVAGPTEVAYFAQLKPVYDYFDVPEPIIYPRASVTLVEEYIRKIIDKFNLNVYDFLSDVEIIKSKVVSNTEDFNIDAVYSEIIKKVDAELMNLRNNLEAIDHTLIYSLENAVGKVNKAINSLKQKTIEARKRQHEISLRQLDKVSIHIHPNSSLQERQLNIIYYLNKYGLEFIQWLMNEVVIDKFMHQVIDVE